MLFLFVMQVYRGFKFFAECISCLPFLRFIDRGYVSRRSLILANNVCWGLMLQFVNFAHAVSVLFAHAALFALLCPL